MNIVNKAVIDMSVKVLVWTNDHVSWVNTWDGIVRSHHICLFKFTKNCQTFHFIFLLAKPENPSFSTLLETLGIISLFNFSHSGGCAEIFPVVLISTSGWRWMWSVFSCVQWSFKYPVLWSDSSVLNHIAWLITIELQSQTKDSLDTIPLPYAWVSPSLWGKICILSMVSFSK